MDDECYCSLEYIKWSDKYNYEQNRTILTNKNKFIGKSKFPEKIMLWIAISKNGISEPEFIKGMYFLNTQF